MTPRCSVISYLLLAVTVVAVALQLRAAWDVAYAGDCSENMANQVYWLYTNATAKGCCPALNKLTVSASPVASSPGRLVFLSHGLLCSVQRDRAHVPCSIVIRIGRPALFRQVVTIARNGPMRVQKPTVTGGVLHSLCQKIEVKDE